MGVSSRTLLRKTWCRWTLRATALTVHGEEGEKNSTTETKVMFRPKMCIDLKEAFVKIRQPANFVAYNGLGCNAAQIIIACEVRAHLKRHIADHAGLYRHEDQGGHGADIHNEAWMSHGHDGCYDECLIPKLRDKDLQTKDNRFEPASEHYH